ncbi:MAG TPA: FHA domain-containing protein [Longimicrobiales bacterium]
MVRVVVAAVQLVLAAVAAVASGQTPVVQDRAPTAPPPEARSEQSRDPHAAPAGSRGATEADSIFDADADLDGVPDLVDRCPATPPGVAVDAAGCEARVGGLLGPGGLAVGAAVLIGLLAARTFFRRRGSAGEDDTTIPPLVFPGTSRQSDEVRPLNDAATHAAQPGRPAGLDRPPAARAPAAASPDSSRAATGAETGRGDAAGGASDGRTVGRPVDVASPRSLEPVQVRSRRGGDAGQPDPAAGVGADGSETELVDARTVRFFRPVGGTMQLLPGRLEIVSGAEPGHTIRFVRLPGVPPEVTFGRARGTPPLHVQLLLPTVSRRHARMRYTEDGWRIMNLSRTNPLVVNGEVLESEAESRKLYDGDRIEMGEIVFVFRER